jgi:hypothetical protein
MYMQRSKKAFPAAFVVGLALEVQLSLLIWGHAIESGRVGRWRVSGFE